ncbi:O-antigen ligase family protein [Terriglobus saanensis]|uniref:O-antigen polymerase n=1 Tax=Terriglobus saanensis (strain ATCC BAA-1853 / DSM 23119 / SP1PR4) TaxID=401053 RepID=E8UYQ3_TERSS|nr:O-antigen ligase family protein [Terriglobus saanensis]ADV83206.1 O-antigen polymerase [Terriglobus saanensis SP1PR4]
MRFFLTLLFIFTAFMSPPVVFGPLAPYHIEIIIAALAFFLSIPDLLNSGLLFSPKVWALVFLGVSVVLSIAASGWIGGGLEALYSFLPLPFTFLMAALNIKTKRHLQIVAITMVLGCAYFIAHGAYDLRNGVDPSPFLYGASTLRRLRGLGVVNDPNDFGQVMVALIPCMFLFKTKNFVANLFLVGIPLSVLTVGLYLTHSRGAAVAIMVMIAVASRRKFGNVPALLLAGCIFASSLALGWSGGRDVSMEAGSDRMAAWSMGIEFIKSHPFVGVGFMQFADFNDGLTAHNTIVVCAAEIGIPGFIFWVMFLLSTLREGATLGHVFARTKATSTLEASTSSSEGGIDKRPESPLATTELPAGSAHFLAGPGLSEADLRQTTRLLVYALIGFLSAGWFLSRAMSMWLFLLTGMLTATIQMDPHRTFMPTKLSLLSLLRWSTATALCLLLVVYGLLRVRGLTGG